MEYSIQSTTSVGRKSQKAALKLSTDERHPNLHGWIVVCIENLIRFDCVAESHNVSANGRDFVDPSIHGARLALTAVAVGL